VIRMMAPDGTLCELPEENVEEAQTEGFIVMTAADLKAMHNRLFFAQKFFEQKVPKMVSVRFPRGRGRW
jgi:hypothetical protein